MQSFLDLPKRAVKPRKKGLTALIDTGHPLQYFKDVVKSHEDFIDTIKFGWGTAYITSDIEAKIAYAKEHDIDVCLGGTFFEKAVSQHKLDAYLDYVKSLGCSILEVSNGTIEMSNREKARYITSLSQDFKVLSEVGYKDSNRSDAMDASRWIEYIQEDLDAGATRVITEARESGESGICNRNGELHDGLIDEMIQANLDMNSLIFEAPNKHLQVYFIQCVGHEVNVGNIMFEDVIALETLRLGLRSDTL